MLLSFKTNKTAEEVKNVTAILFLEQIKNIAIKTSILVQKYNETVDGKILEKVFG